MHQDTDPAVLLLRLGDDLGAGCSIGEVEPPSADGDFRCGELLDQSVGGDRVAAVGEGER